MTLAPSLHFTERAPAPELSRWVARYWGFEVGPGAPAVHHVPPDGATSLLIRLGPGPPPVVLLSGPWLQPLTVPILPGESYLGARLQAGSQAALLGAPGIHFANQTVPLANHFGARATALALELVQSATLNAAATVFDRFFLGLTTDCPRPDALVEGAYLLLVASGGELPISNLANKLGTSQRTLLRRFSAATGLTPKQYARVCRFRTTASQLLALGSPLSQVAARGGYADQPHFNREVLSLTGMTPTALAERTSRISHQLMGPT